MLPDVNHPVWRQIVTGEKKMQSSKSTINLLIQSSKMSYARNPSPANLEQLIAKMYSFFTRYESTFSSEIAQLHP
ncbi:MAG: hypothetical protein ABR906_04270 [Terracidiphilus sp.]|jgi:hypothetical protein